MIQIIEDFFALTRRIRTLKKEEREELKRKVEDFYRTAGQEEVQSHQKILDDLLTDKDMHINMDSNYAKPSPRDEENFELLAYLITHQE